MKVFQNVIGFDMNFKCGQNAFKINRKILRKNMRSKNG